MTREQIIETMARAICDQWGYVWDGDPEDDQTAPETNVGYDERPSKQLYRQAATAALAALEAAGLAVVPVEASEAICEAIVEIAEIYDEWGVDKHVSNSDAVYEAAIKAAQGAHKP